MSSILKVDEIQDTSGNNIINENANTITIGKSGDTVALASGATQSGFGLSGWSEDGANNNLLPASSSAGIYLGVTTATASNLLDDYEEGTWTPGVVGFTTSSSQGYYRKIGNQVTVWFTYESTTNLSTSFAYDITGLPFAPTTYGYSSTGGTFGLLKFVTTTLGRGLTVSLGSYESTKLRASIFNFNGTTADASYDDGLTGMATYFID